MSSNTQSDQQIAQPKQKRKLQQVAPHLLFLPPPLPPSFPPPPVVNINMAAARAGTLANYLNLIPKFEAKIGNEVEQSAERRNFMEGMFMAIQTNSLANGPANIPYTRAMATVQNGINPLCAYNTRDIGIILNLKLTGRAAEFYGYHVQQRNTRILIQTTGTVSLSQTMGGMADCGWTFVPTFIFSDLTYDIAPNGVGPFAAVPPNEAPFNLAPYRLAIGPVVGASVLAIPCVEAILIAAQMYAAAIGPRVEINDTLTAIKDVKFNPNDFEGYRNKVAAILQAQNINLNVPGAQKGFFQILEAQFKCPGAIRDKIRELRNFKYKAPESISTYNARFQRLIDNANQQNADVELLIDWYIKGLPNQLAQFLETQISQWRINNLNYFHPNFGATNYEASVITNLMRMAVAASNLLPKAAQINEVTTVNECFTCGKQGHIARNCPNGWKHKQQPYCQRCKARHFFGQHIGQVRGSSQPIHQQPWNNHQNQPQPFNQNCKCAKITIVGHIKD
ncbi:hypothetical protein C1645_822405 [Glomus cerebriforme]|uniref:CCHC-type domain-containing protein n=1 Tax=Glomus cerebriforme TaxID=658196 RepID=A0A397T4T1_9GLOM|nr:hypothetical protein C1645_822405 [Glomus cerebriforme]